MMYACLVFQGPNGALWSVLLSETAAQNCLTEAARAYDAGLPVVCVASTDFRRGPGEFFTWHREVVR